MVSDLQVLCHQKTAVVSGDAAPPDPQNINTFRDHLISDFWIGIQLKEKNIINKTDDSSA